MLVVSILICAYVWWGEVLGIGDRCLHVLIVLGFQFICVPVLDVKNLYKN